MAGLLSGPETNQSPWVPKRGVPSPNISPKPKARKAMDETANTMKFLPNTATTFLARQNPASNMAKPRFMKKTKKAVTRTQMVSMATLASPSLSASSLVNGTVTAASFASWASATAGPASTPTRAASKKNPHASLQNPVMTPPSWVRSGIPVSVDDAIRHQEGQEPCQRAATGPATGNARGYRPLGREGRAG